MWFMQLLWPYLWMTRVFLSAESQIDIGAILDKDKHIVAKTALRYMIEKHNNSTRGIKLGKYEESVDLTDSYALTKQICSALAKGVIVFYGLTNTMTSNVVESYMRTLHMPFITPSAPYNDTMETEQGYMVYMRPSYGPVIADLVKYYKWPKVFYIYDSEGGLLRLQELYSRLLGDNPVEVDAQRLTNVHNAYAILRHIDVKQQDREKYIILDLSSEGSLQAVLTQVQHLGMNRARYHYLLGTLAMDELDLVDFVHGGVNITGFRLINPDMPVAKEAIQSWTKLAKSAWPGAGGPILQLEAALTMDVITTIDKTREILTRKNPQVFYPIYIRGKVYNGKGASEAGLKCDANPVSEWILGPDLFESATQVKFQGVTGHIEFDRYGNRKFYQLDIMEMGLNNHPRKIGEWKKGDLEIYNRNITKHEYISPRQNKTRIVTSILEKPYLMLKEAPEDGKMPTGNDMYEGYCADLTRQVAKIVGFDYIIKPVEDGSYGTNTAEGWNGMVGEVTRKKADIAVAPLTIMSSRERVIDFSKPFMSMGISIMIKKPEKQKPGVFSFMDPLSREIWACIIVAYLGVSVVLFIVSRFSPYEWQIEDSVNGPTFTNDFTILNSLWFSLAAFMQQGCDISPRSVSGRIVGSVWWFFTLIIISSYTANLAAFLTVERMLTPINSADDLAKQTEILYGTVNSGSSKDFFKEARIDVYKKMWNFMNNAKPNVFEEKIDLGVERVRNSKGKYAFLLESTMNDYFNQRKPCNTMKVGSNLDSKGYGIATHLYSDLREKINLAVLQLREEGELQKLKKKWWYDKGECAVDGQGKDSKQSSLSLSNVAGIFYILIGGLGMSMVISLLEFLYKSRTEVRRRRAMFRQAGRNGESLSFQPGPVGENGGVGFADNSEQYKSMSTVPIARSSAVSLV